ncbi:MAG TPA: DUF5668 domain-containing protein [Candidatus Dormibacteraeota bacterium]|nr:DUF5668 domain-containing protein [Candidatus Dormibacteraeota bacterium]
MNAPLPDGRRHRYRGLVWPGILILFGILALLVNTDVIPADRLYRLWDLWPVLLVVLGLELLIQRSRMPSPAGAVAAWLIVLLAIVGAAAYVAAGPALGSASLDAVAPAGDLTSASMEIDVGGATINISGDSSLEDLYRAHIDYSGPKPDVSFESVRGAVRISQGSGGVFAPSRHFSIDVRLSTRMTWSLTINAGGANETLKLQDVKVSAISLSSGGSTGDITLGQPQGTVPITISGGGLTMHLHRPSGVAATVRISGAAVSLTFDGRHHGGLGSVEDSSGEAADSYDVTVSGAGCTVTMDVTPQT